MVLYLTHRYHNCHKYSNINYFATVTNPKIDKYMKILCEVISSSTKEEQQKNYNKIIKNISREVIIDKAKTMS
jgi:hypothetical protein